MKVLKLDHENNTLSFQFSALDFGDPKNNKYKFKLDGFDETGQKLLLVISSATQKFPQANTSFS